MRRLTSAISIALLLGASSAQASDLPCLSPGEFTALSTYALPSVITGVSQRCGSALGADAFLRSDGTRLAQRYAARQQAAWPAAKAAFLRLAQVQSPDTAQVLGGLPDSSLRPLADSFIVAGINQKLPTDRCTAIDRLVRLLSPLPAESTAELIGLAAGLGARSNRARVGDISICAA